MKRVWMLAACLVAVPTASWAAAGTASATSFGAVAWGENGSGQLGNGTKVDRDVPFVVDGLSGVTAVSASGDHTLALLSSGKVMAWGDNEHGQLGDGTTTSRTTPVEVSGLSEATAVAAGDQYSLALLSNGTVKAWGFNGDAELGDGTETESRTPVSVSELSGVTAIAASDSDGLALLSNGTVEAWGLNFDGQLGDGSSKGPEECGSFLPSACSKKPTPVSGLSNVMAISAGQEFNLALRKNGTVEAWGLNQTGQLGDGTETGPEKCSTPFVEQACSETPVEVSELTNVTAIAAGGEFGVALLENGSVKAWGANEDGSLGNGSEVASDTPVTVSELSGVTAIAAGGAHSLALLSSGALKAWGSGAAGQLGDGTEKSSKTPVAVSAASGTVGIAAGAGTSIAFGGTGPGVTSVSPGTGSSKGGTPVTITGSNFTGVTAVEFGGVAAKSFTVNSPTSITAVSPGQPPAKKVSILVTTEVGTSDPVSGDQFTYVAEGNIEFGRCTKVGAGKGKYQNSKCIELLEGGSFEWMPGVTKTGFTNKDSTETVEKKVVPKQIAIESVGGSRLVCQNESGSGSFLGTRELTEMVLKFTGCELGEAKCSSTGAAEGEIATSSLDADLGWRNKESNLVGLVFAPAVAEESFLQASCGSASVVLNGSVIAAVTPVNDGTAAKYEIKFKMSKGKQSPEQFEGESPDVLSMSVSGGAFEQAGLTFDSTQANEEAVEINTVV